MLSRRDASAAVAILVGTFAIFRLSPINPTSDSRYQMLFSEQLLWKRSFSVEASAFGFQSSRPVALYQRCVDFPYQLERVGERFYCWFPPGSTILSTPYVGLANTMGLSTLDQQRKYNPQVDVQLQAGLAAVLMAILCVVIFFTARLFLPLGWSSLITAASALGTQIWSTASRTMWIHTWGILILGLVVWQIARAETKQVRLNPILLGSCLSWLYFVRPTFSISIVAVAIYVLLYHRKIFLPFFLTGCLWLGAFVGYSYYHFGQPLPLYYRSQPDLFSFGQSFWHGFAGNLVSPARGLLIYLPILIFIAYLLGVYRRSVRAKLGILGGSVICVHLIVISGYTRWYGGHCYGARYSTDVIPWIILLGILAVEAKLRWAANNPAKNSAVRLRTEWAFALLLLFVSVTLNGIGACSPEAWYWNAVPNDVATHLDRLWDWRHPPFLGLPDGAQIPR